jgi:hypothetical protein
VNAAYLMLTTAWLAGQTPAPPAAAPPEGAKPVPVAPAPAAAPVVSTSLGGCNGGGCGGYGGCATDCCDSGGKRGLLSRLFNKHRNDCGCEAAPTCCAPAPVSCGDCCEGHRPSLCGKLKGLFHKNRGGDCGCESSCGCGSTVGGCCNGGGAIIGGAPIGTGAPAEAIPAQPKPGEAPRKMPSTTPMTMNGVIHDVTPVVAPRLGIEQEGPKQPF